MTTRQLPSNDEVRLAMDLILQESAETGRRPTITAVEGLLDIAHPTFYRNYPELIGWFKQQRQDQTAPRQAERTVARRDPVGEMARLRRENQELRTITKLYAEAIRQLTLDHAELEAKVNVHAGVTTLDAHRRC